MSDDTPFGFSLREFWALGDDKERRERERDEERASEAAREERMLGA